MHAKTVKKQCTFARNRAVNKLFQSGNISGDLSADIGRFIGRYFKYRLFFCCKRCGERFPHIVSAAAKKEISADISADSADIQNRGLLYFCWR